jgi:hypothetical protein
METIEYTDSDAVHDLHDNEEAYRTTKATEPNIDQHLANIEAARAAAPAIREQLRKERAGLDLEYSHRCIAIDAKLQQVDRMLGVTPAPATKRRGRPPLTATSQPSDMAPKKRGWQKGRPRGPRTPKV